MQVESTACEEIDPISSLKGGGLADELTPQLCNRENVEEKRRRRKEEECYIVY